MKEKTNEKKNNLKNNFRNILINIWVVYTLLFPRDLLNLKEIIFALTIFLSFPAIKERFKEKDSFVFVFLSCIFPVTIILFSVIAGDSSLKDAISSGFCWFYLLLIPVIDYYDVNYRKGFLIGTFIIAICINIIYFFDKLNIISIFKNPIVLFFSTMKEMYYGKGEVSTFGYSIFFKATPILIISNAYYLKNRKWAMSLIYTLALLFSGTRANMIVALLETMLIVYINTENKRKKIIVVLLISIAVSLLLPILIDKMITLNELKKIRSDYYRINAIETIFNSLNENKLRYIFGTGLGSYFYFPARQMYVNVVEVSYFDYFRQVGIYGFAILMYFLYIPIKKLLKSDMWIIIAYIGYLGISFTNPLLVTSTSFIMYVLIFSGELSSEQKKLI